MSDNWLAEEVKPEAARSAKRARRLVLFVSLILVPLVAFGVVVFANSKPAATITTGSPTITPQSSSSIVGAQPQTNAAQQNESLAKQEAAIANQNAALAKQKLDNIASSKFDPGTPPAAVGATAPTYVPTTIPTPVYPTCAYGSQIATTQTNLIQELAVAKNLNYTNTAEIQALENDLAYYRSQPGC